MAVNLKAQLVKALKGNQNITNPVALKSLENTAKIMSEAISAYVNEQISNSNSS